MPFLNLRPNVQTETQHNDLTYTSDHRDNINTTGTDGYRTRFGHTWHQPDVLAHSTISLVSNYPALAPDAYLAGTSSTRANADVEESGLRELDLQPDSINPVLESVSSTDADSQQNLDDLLRGIGLGAMDLALEILGSPISEIPAEGSIHPSRVRVPEPGAPMQLYVTW